MIAITIGIAGVFVLAVSHDLWLTAIGRFLVVADPPGRADAVVPLAGERLRVMYAADLYLHGNIRWYVITDMWVANSSPGTSYADSVRHQAIDSGVPPQRIRQADGQAASTYQEALNLRRPALEQHWRSLVIVTSPFHTRRARLILDDVFRNTGISVSVQPVRGHWFSATNWWTSPDGLKVTAQEYAKLALYLAGYDKLISIGKQVKPWLLQSQRP